LDMVRRRANPGDVEQLLLDTARQDGNGSALDSARTRDRPARARRSITVSPTPETGDMLTQFGPFRSQCSAGNVKIRRGSWNEELFRVLEGFPDLAHDDEVDACSGALEMLNPPMQNPPMQSWGAYELACQMAEEVRAAQERKPQPAPPIRPPVR